MQLTQEQLAIINSSGNIKINAVAGSGKTTTIIEYAKSRPMNSKILYLAFNRSVKLEAEKKFSEKGLKNVKIETAHSLAYKHVVFANKYRVNAGYKTHEVKELLKLTGTSEKHGEYILANHVNRFAAYFCNSDKLKVQELNYLDLIGESKAKAFVSKHYQLIETLTRVFLSKMNKGEIDVIHDFYLKKYQLSNPRLPYDYILFDEGQDASPVMLDIFLKQKATKVIVGDMYQQIYGWRHAVNSLEKTDYRNFYLSTSFRFHQDIANLALKILDWKRHIGDYKAVTISGIGEKKEFKSKAVIARTNLGLLLKAIEYTVEKKDINHIYFEGNINSYTYAEDGASLFDVLNLYNGHKHRIKDKLISSMKDLDELVEFVDKTSDIQLGMMIDIVKEYGNKIPGILKIIKEKHVGDHDKNKAQMVFSTVHRCKGMEYDAVQLVNDFLDEKKLMDIIENQGDNTINPAKLHEEINLLYVAVTRTRNSIHIPENLLPEGISKSSHIHIQQDNPLPQNKNEKLRQAKNKNQENNKSYSLDDIRQKHIEAYKPWTKEMDDELEIMFCEGITTKDMARHFGRTRGAINSRIKKLQLEEKYY